MKIQIGDIVKVLDYANTPGMYVVGKVEYTNDDFFRVKVLECSHYERVLHVVTVVPQGKKIYDELGERITILKAAPRKVQLELDPSKNYAVVDLDKAKASVEFISKNVSPEVLQQLKTIYNFEFIRIEIDN